MVTDIKEGLLEFISQEFLIDKTDIDVEENLVDQGVIDSFGFVEIASFLEQELSIVIIDDMINIDNFGSINNIVKFVEKF